MGVPVTVGVFSEDEALTFLAQRTGLDDEADAREVTRELGSLPLGLAQAAALIVRERLGYATYLRRLRSVPLAEYLGRVEEIRIPTGRRKRSCCRCMPPRTLTRRAGALW